MQGRFVPVLFFCVISGVICAPALAVQPALQPLARPAIKHSLLLYTGGGCGWDYPCPPDPGFGRPLHSRGGEIVIHNNYGPINVYPGDGDAVPPEVKDERGSEDCYVSPCERCGPLCWLRRLRHGYCGHGCLAYLEQARAEAEAREEDAEREREGREGPLLCEDRFECRENCPERRCRRAYAPPPPPPPCFERGCAGIHAPPPAYYGGRPRRAYAPPRRGDWPPPSGTPYLQRRETPRGGPGPADLAPRERLEGPPYPRE